MYSWSLKNVHGGFRDVKLVTGDDEEEDGLVVEEASASGAFRLTDVGSDFLLGDILW